MVTIIEFHQIYSTIQLPLKCKPHFKMADDEEDESLIEMVMKKKRKFLNIEELLDSVYCRPLFIGLPRSLHRNRRGNKATPYRAPKIEKNQKKSFFVPKISRKTSLSRTKTRSNSRFGQNRVPKSEIGVFSRF